MARKITHEVHVGLTAEQARAVAYYTERDGMPYSQFCRSAIAEKLEREAERMKEIESAR